MPNKLSHSSASKFQDCAKKWQYHYLERWRSKTQSAALLFGSAIDSTLTSILTGMKNKEDRKDPKQVFAYFWRFGDINGEKTFLYNSDKIVYANSDYDPDLLLLEDIQKLKEDTGLPDPLEEVEKIYKDKEYAGFDFLPSDRKKILNMANWLCLYRKGLLMIEALETQVIPNIKEVLGSQERVSLENESGDSIVGFADMVVRWKDYPQPVILDLKTSTKVYEKDSVVTSPQLTLYVHGLSDKFEHTRYAGFIVLNKQVKKNKTKTCVKCLKDGTGQKHKTCDSVVDGKRCHGEWEVKLNPEVFVQEIINEIPEQTEDIVLQNMDDINELINKGIFPRSFSSCIKPYGKCEFYNKCYFNKNDDIIKLENKV